MAEKDDLRGPLGNEGSDVLGSEDVEGYDPIMDNDETIEAGDTVAPETEVLDVSREDGDIFSYDEEMYEVKGDEMSFDEEDSSLMGIEELLEEIEGRDNIPLDEVTDAEIVRYLDEGIGLSEEELIEEEPGAMGGFGRGASPAARPSSSRASGAESVLEEIKRLLNEAASKNPENSSRRGDVSPEDVVEMLKNLISLAGAKGRISSEESEGMLKELGSLAGRGAGIPSEEVVELLKDLISLAGRKGSVSSEEVVEMFKDLIDLAVRGESTASGEPEEVEEVVEIEEIIEEFWADEKAEAPSASTYSGKASDMGAAHPAPGEPSPLPPGSGQESVSMEEIDEVLKEVEDLSLGGDEEMKTADAGISADEMDGALTETEGEPSPPPPADREVSEISLEEIDRILAESEGEKVEEVSDVEGVSAEEPAPKEAEELPHPPPAPPQESEISLEEIDRLLAQSEGEEVKESLAEEIAQEVDLSGLLKVPDEVAAAEYELEKEEAQEIDAWVVNLKGRLDEVGADQPRGEEAPEEVIEAIEVVDEAKLALPEHLPLAVGSDMALMREDLKSEEPTLDLEPEEVHEISSWVEGLKERLPSEGEEVIEAVDVVEERPAYSFVERAAEAEALFEGKATPSKDEVLESVFTEESDLQGIPEELAAALDSGSPPEGRAVERVFLKDRGEVGGATEPIQLVVDDVELRIKEGTSVLVHVAKGSLISVWWKKKK